MAWSAARLFDNALESEWIPSPLPAVYSGDKMKPYRRVAH